MEATIAKAGGPMVLTGGTLAMGGSTGLWLVPVVAGAIVAAFALFIVARAVLTRKARRGRHV